MNEFRDLLNRFDKRLRLLERRPASKVRQIAGTVVMSCSNSNVVFTAVTFPTGAFTGIPKVMTTNQSAPGGSSRAVPRAINVTSVGFSLYLYAGDDAPMTFTGMTVAWHAVQDD